MAAGHARYVVLEEERPELGRRARRRRPFIETQGAAS